MTPTINVNLKPCSPSCLVPSWAGARPIAHFDTCAAAHVLLPCPIPRSVEMMARSGECTCRARAESQSGFNYLATSAREAIAEGRHLNDCPGKPIRVSCSIGGDGTWAGSEVVESGVFRDQNIVGPLVLPSQMVGIEATCRERWELVKALVLGNPLGRRGADSVSAGIVIIELFEQRDAVFAALADMAKAEEAAVAAQKRADAAFPIDNYVKVPAPDHRSEPRPSTVRLAAFVAHVSASVGAL